MWGLGEREGGREDGRGDGREEGREEGVNEGSWQHREPNLAVYPSNRGEGFWVRGGRERGW